MSNVIPIRGKPASQSAEDNAIYVLTFLARTVPMNGCDYSGDEEFHNGADLISVALAAMRLVLRCQRIGCGNMRVES
jgi:hypothetical protein